MNNMSQLTRKKQRIALLIASFRAGGAERVTINLANELAARQYETYVVVLSAEGPFRSDVSSDIHIVDLKAERALFSLHSLVRFFRTVRPEIFISNLTHLNVLSIIANKLSANIARVFVVEHSHMSSVVKNGRRFLDKFGPLFVKFCYPAADKILAVSQGVADDLAVLGDLSKTRIEVIRNSIISDDFAREKQMPVTDVWFQRISKPLIVSAGRLVQQKGFDMLIQAIYEIGGIYPVQLVILGEGPERKALEKQIIKLGLQGDVLLPGYVQNPFRYMAKAKVFALSSRSEGFSSVLIEAMACGTSIVSTDCQVGPREILMGGKLGALVPVGDSSAMAQAILSVLDTPQDPVKLIARAEQYTAKFAADSYISLF
ncbi:MAG: glycosyltransferase [Anaerolineales bacterium]|nr:MAG: glycosyltransferase [Anaerolineales bacterium]